MIKEKKKKSKHLKLLKGTIFFTGRKDMDNCCSNMLIFMNQALKKNCNFSLINPCLDFIKEMSISSPQSKFTESILTAYSVVNNQEKVQVTQYPHVELSIKYSSTKEVENSQVILSSIGIDQTDDSSSKKTMNSTLYSNSTLSFSSSLGFFSIDIYSLPTDIVIKTLSTKKDLVDCMANCSKRGNCISYDGNQYKCSCNNNYFGKECQTDIRPCTMNLCLNQGVCNITGNNCYKCLCSKNYYGLNCEFEVDLCKNVTCSMHGYCYVENFQTRCRCLYLYYGDKCENETDDLRMNKIVSWLSMIIAIIIILCFWLIVIAIDVCNFMGIAKRSRQKKQKIKKVKLVYLN